MRTRSLAGPIFLIGLGAIFLLQNVLPDFSIWKLLGEWWPLLLIGFGFIRVVEVLIRRQPSDGLWLDLRTDFPLCRAFYSASHQPPVAFGRS